MVTEGRVQGTILDEDASKYTLFSAEVAPGNSGGPVVRRNGMHYEIVGVVSALYVTTIGGFYPNMLTHVAFMVGADEINKFINE
jgi:hypothetical protein